MLPGPEDRESSDDDDDDTCEFFLTSSPPMNPVAVTELCEHVLRTPSDLVDVDFQNCVLADTVSFVVCNGSSSGQLSEEPIL